MDRTKLLLKLYELESKIGDEYFNISDWIINEGSKIEDEWTVNVPELLDMRRKALREIKIAMEEVIQSIKS